MDHPDAIKYELGLTIVIAVGFWIWQTVDLKRAARELKDREDAEVGAPAPETPADEAR